jgi:hypothetical protein
VSSPRTVGSSNCSHAVWDPGPQSCGTPAITRPTMLSSDQADKTSLSVYMVHFLIRNRVKDPGSLKPDPDRDKGSKAKTKKKISAEKINYNFKNDARG